MPSLEDSIRQASGTRVNRSAVPQAQQNKPAISTQPSSLQWTRSPVPPVAISPDSLNMFANSGQVPQSRLLPAQPLFTDTSSVGNITITNTVSNRGNSGGGTSGGGTTVVTAPKTSLNTGFVTPAISQGVPYQTTFQIARSFFLLSVSVSSPARVEFYSTANARTSDASRGTSQPIVPGSPDGLIADLNLIQPSELNWAMSPAAPGANGDSPTSATIYVTVTNQTASSQPITVSITYFPLEA